MSVLTNSVVLVTRPIQYLNAVNIPYTDFARTLLIVDDFEGAQSLKSRSEEPGSGYANVVMLDTVEAALNWVREHKDNYTDFFTFSDFGLRLCMRLARLRPLRIHVYEEGAGTYARDEFRLGSVRFLASLFSSGKIKLFRHMGECRFVDTIYVNHVELYSALYPASRKKVRGFSVPLMDHLAANSVASNIARILPEDAPRRDALLYLSGWTAQKSIFNVLAAHPLHLSIAKIHPAYVGPCTFLDKFDLSIEQEVVAEVAIAELAEGFRSLIVVHECSSAVLNCRISGLNFKDINLGSAEKAVSAKFNVIMKAVEKVSHQRRRKNTPEKDDRVIR